MSVITSFLDVIIHLDKYLLILTQSYGLFVYLIIFLIILGETGLVIAPILPGDSLLFVSGTLAAAGMLNFYFLLILLAVAAILGDSLNYAIGSYFGPKVFRSNGFFFNKKYLEKTKEFYKKHGGKTIILARFMPIIRTFAPLVAGMGKMDYPRFLSFNIIGGIAWVALFLSAGYFFGNIPVVKNNLTIAILAIVIVSFLPAIITYLKRKFS